MTERDAEGRSPVSYQGQLEIAVDDWNRSQRNKIDNRERLARLVEEGRKGGDEDEWADISRLIA